MFNFELTKRPVSIFIPNFGRAKYINLLKEQFITKADPKDYIIVVGNDGIDESFANLAHLNVVSFTLDRTPTERNGAFIRNYFIRKCLSDFIYQKDPEILLSGLEDPILDMVDKAKRYPDFIIRPKFTASIDQATTEHIFDIDTTKWFLPQLDDIKDIPIDSPERIHYLFGASTNTLQAIGGYSEEFTHYGPEDRDMFNRLLRTKKVLAQPTSWLVTHFWHPVNPIVYEKLGNMHLVERMQDQTAIVRNVGKNWGQG